MTLSTKQITGLKRSVLQSHSVIKISIHLIVDLVNSINSGGEVDEELSDFFQAFLFLDVPTLGEGLQEI